MLFSQSFAVGEDAQYTTPAASKRLPWLDIAKVYGIFLVYYGHFVERIADLQGFVTETAAFSQYKFIYAFHMPLFFILSGYVYKDRKQPFFSFLNHRLLTRILPAVFFNLVAVGFHFLKGLATGDTGFAERYHGRNLLAEVISGYPFGNFITWFLVCLFTVELLNYLAQPLVKGSLLRRVGLALVGLIAGYYLGRYQGQMPSLPLRGWNTWYFNEALIGFAFYQVGILLKRLKIIECVQQSLYRYAGLCMTLMVTIAMFDFNQGPFTDTRHLALMAVSSHGNLFFFTMTAIVGALAIICLSLCTSANQRLTFFGQNTLVLLGLNFFFAGFTKPIVGKIGLSVFESWWTVLLLCTALTVISFAASTPVIWLLHRFLPQLIGKPRVQGPLLPPLLRTP